MPLIDIAVPDIGDFKDVAVIELLVKVGDTVKAEQSLISVESDKASMEIPSSAAGVVKEIKVAVGDKVNQGSVIVVLEAAHPNTVRAEPVPERKWVAQPERRLVPQRTWPPTSSANCSSWAPAPVAIRPHSAAPISA